MTRHIDLDQYLKLGQVMKSWNRETVQALIEGRFVTFVNPFDSEHREKFHLASEEECGLLVEHYGLEDFQPGTRRIAMRTREQPSPSQRKRFSETDLGKNLQSIFDRTGYRANVRDSCRIQVDALRIACKEEGWDIPEAVIASLDEHAPQGLIEPCIPVLRIRFGAGNEGVAMTFEAHMRRIERVFGADRFQCHEALRNGIDRLRLVVGNHTHKPTLEWVIVEENRARLNPFDIPKTRFLADEALAQVWMFPEMFQAPIINNVGFYSLCARGYETETSPLRVGFNFFEERIEVDIGSVFAEDPDHLTLLFRE